MSAAQQAVTRYPGIAEYNEAVQNASAAFADPELSSGKLATSKLGLPIVLGGGFALTYTVTAKSKASKSQKYAVRCFHRYVPDLEQRYAQISQAIGRISGPHFVGFEFQREGVRVKGGRYPVLKMAWAEGPTFGSFLEDNYDDAVAMRALAGKFRELARFLAGRGLAHGDLEGSNLVVRNGALTLIDYDGMYVPGMALGKGNELGHAHYQHPGRETRHFGPRIDDFSFILIDIALAAVAADKTLYEQFCNGDNLLFQKPDLVNPKKSAVFQRVRKIAALKAKVDDFAKICERPIDQVPSLHEFLTRHEGPQPAIVASPASPAPAAKIRPAVRPVPAPPRVLAATPPNVQAAPSPAAVSAAAAVPPARPPGTSNLDYVRSALAARQGAPSPASAAAAPGKAAPAPGAAIWTPPGASPPPAPTKRSLVSVIHWVELAVAAAILIGFLGFQL